MREVIYQFQFFIMCHTQKIIKITYNTGTKIILHKLRRKYSHENTVKKILQSKK